jgi:hypothetical protein
MAHYAFLDENNNNIVTEVIPGRNEDEVVDGITDWEAAYGAIRNQVCKRTSYNTVGGVHANGGTPYRKNYAGVGYTYDQARDAFIAPKPFDSWVLDEETCQWQAPTPYPTDGFMYQWVEDDLNWQAITLPTE